MTSLVQQRSERWQAILHQIAAAYQALDRDEKRWLAPQLQQIEQLQQELDLLFQQADGATACQGCQGGCCAKGHNHMTLVNLLGYLQAGELPPAPDFAATCPFLAEQGCLLPAGRRPYNCISFVCDIIENALGPAEVERFYRLEQGLRSLYLQVAKRYTGGGMTGLLLQAERLAGRPFLARMSDSTDPVPIADRSC